MNAKEKILAAIRRQSPARPPLPSLDGDWIAYPDAHEQFAAALQSVGGQVVQATSFVDLPGVIHQLPPMEQAAKIVCTVPGLPLGNCVLDDVPDPHELADVDVAIVAGRFAVAENGAVWVEAGRLRHRAVCFICQHLVLVVPQDQVVHNMHQAYQRLAFAEPGYGVFISGPSKTADIEQSLVIGAHGARSLTVALVAGWDGGSVPPGGGLG